MTLPPVALDTENLRRALESKRAELFSRRDAEGITIERSADSMDQLVLANQRELIVDRLNREATLLRQVSDALERMTTGEYGICPECGQPISARRLAALPWAALCIQCQEAADREMKAAEGSYGILEAA